MQAPTPYQEKRPWGEFVEFIRNAPSTVKIITVNVGEAFSLQTHSKRDEFWHVISGEGSITIGDAQFAVRSGQDHFIPRGTNHRIEAGEENVVILEISLGDFDEADITRLEDRYGRIT
jgi:mannose-6-phosphate isomerase